jgi:hypothetical protein
MEQPSPRWKSKKCYVPTPVKSRKRQRREAGSTPIRSAISQSHLPELGQIVQNAVERTSSDAGSMHDPAPIISNA